MKTASASAILLLLGIWAVWEITDAFEVLTTEQARRLEISRRQPDVPGVRLVDQGGRTFLLDEWVREKNSVLIVDFIYTSCQSLCRAQGTEFQQLQQSIVERRVQHRVHLLSVSFDPEHDTHAVLRQYAEHLQARAGAWTFATARSAEELDTMLRTFGVTVIPDQRGGFQHNAAEVWVAPSGKLVRVTDFDSGEHQRLLDELTRPI